MQKTEEFLSEIRTSMYRNYRVGKIKYFKKAKEDNPAAILLQVIEFCGRRWSTYHLWINVSDRFIVKSDDLNKWVLVGFYLKSFMDSSAYTQYNTSLKMRHFELLGQDDLESITIGENETVEETDMMDVPTHAIEVSKDIFDRTTFSPESTDESFL